MNREHENKQGAGEETGSRPAVPEHQTETARADASTKAEAAVSSPPEPQTVSLARQDFEDLDRKARERDAYRNELLRAKADLDNYQKRTRKERQLWEDHAVNHSLRRFLPVVDNLERALDASAQEGSTVQSLADGVRLTHQLLRGVLEDQGVVEIPALGERFDPAVHEAVVEEETSDRPTGSVVSVLEKGYRRSETVLRAARVTVARNPGADGQRCAGSPEGASPEVDPPP